MIKIDLSGVEHKTRTKCAASAVSVARDLGTVWTLAPRQDQILKLQVTLSAS